MQEQPATIRVGPYVGLIQPRQRGGFPYRHFLIECGCISFEIVRQLTPGDQTPNVFVRVRSKTLAELRGCDGAVQRAREIVEALGGIILADLVSRVDVCLDLVNVGIRPFVELYRGEWYTSRTRHDAAYRKNRKCTGITFGKGDIVLRIYDKSTELNESGDEAKQIALLNAVGLDALPVEWTRIEYQLRREAMKPLGISSWSNWIEKRSSATRYLTNEWFRLIVEGADHRHVDRAETHPLWEQVASVFEEVFGPGQVMQRVYSSGKATLIQLKRQAVGLAMTIAASAGDMCSSAAEVGQLLYDAFDEIRETLTDKDLQKRYFQRKARYDAKSAEQALPGGRRVGLFDFEE